MISSLAHKPWQLSQTCSHKHTHTVTQIKCYTQTRTETRRFIACKTIAVRSDLTGLKRDAVIFWTFSLNKDLER